MAKETHASRRPKSQPAEQLKDQPGKETEMDQKPIYLRPAGSGPRLKGKAALITGGDSGIGRAVAVLFAREGCDVAILHLDEAEDAQVTRTAVEAEGRKALVIAGDVRERAFCVAAVERVLGRVAA